MKPKITFQDDGKVHMEYGGSLGSETFPSIIIARQRIPQWVENHRKVLARELKELDRIEREIWDA